ncbi:MAG: Mbeg1-like protein [Streptococcus sp.]
MPELDYQQIVFRGTDDSVIGWKEDFQLTYSREIPAHRSAIAFCLSTCQTQWLYRCFWTFQGW